MTNKPYPYEVGHYVLVTHPDSLMTPNKPCEVVKVLKSGEYVVAQGGYAETWAGEWLALYLRETGGETVYRGVDHNIMAGYVAPPEPYRDPDYKMRRADLMGDAAELASNLRHYMHKHGFLKPDNNESEPDND